MREDPTLDFLTSTFRIKLCTGSDKLFADCTPWELLNLDPPTVVSIPEQLKEHYNISSEALSSILHPYSIHHMRHHNRMSPRYSHTARRNILRVLEHG